MQAGQLTEELYKMRTRVSAMERQLRELGGAGEEGSASHPPPP